jgi:excisionase family DNA binding protein
MSPLDPKQRVIDLTIEQLTTIMKGVIYSQGNALPIPELKKGKLLNVQQAADLLGYEVSTIYDKTHRRTIPFLKKQGKIWFREDELLAWAQTGKKETIEHLSNNIHLKTKRK